MAAPRQASSASLDLRRRGRRARSRALGYIVTDMNEGMKLGFIEGFDRNMIQRCLTLDFGQAVSA